MHARPRSVAPALLGLALLSAPLAGCPGPERGFPERPPVDATDVADMDAPVDAPAEDVQPDRPFMCPGSGTELSGTALTPNGEDPVPGAVVYVTREAPPAIDPGVACDACQLPPGVLGFTQTGVDGRFTIPHVLDTGGAAYVAIQKGRFRRVVPVTFADCNPVALDASQTRLPGRRADGDVPRILVATDVLDNIGRVIERVGVTEFDRVAGCRDARPGANLTSGACEFGALLADRARLAQYNIVFAPCGSLGFSYSWQVLGEPQNAAIVANVREFLQRGGRLYTSDTSYGLLERAFPDAVEFAGGTRLSYMNRDPANVGFGGSPSNPREYTGTTADAELEAWMRGRRALAADGTVPLTGFISPWSAMASTPAATKVWIRGAVEWFTGSAGEHAPAGVRPLTVSAEYRGDGSGCGRVVYTSYEVDSRATGALTPQERVLEWLLFELGGCVAPPG